MLFRLKEKSAPHRDANGKVYEAGDTIESDDDLAAMWPTKLDLVSGSPEQGNIPTPPSIPQPKVKKGGAESKAASPKPVKDEVEEEGEYGKDVTSNFSGAKEKGFKVFTKANWFTVVDANDGERMNEKKLHKDGVVSFLEKYESPDEDKDEDDEDEDESESKSKSKPKKKKKKSSKKEKSSKKKKKKKVEEDEDEEDDDEDDDDEDEDDEDEDEDE